MTDPTATLALLAERYPRCFSLRPGRRQPLKVGIHIDLLHDLNGAITEKKINRFLRYYTNGVCYLNNSQPGSWRYDLAGNHVGEVTADEAAQAKQRLALTYQKIAARAASAVLVQLGVRGHGQESG